MAHNKRVNEFLNLSLEPTQTLDIETIRKQFDSVFKDFKTSGKSEKIRLLYADKFYFNDTFRTIRDIETLVEYMEETTNNIEATNVTIHDIVQGEQDYYLRWSMTMEFTAKGKKVESTSIGMTQLRFNEQGKVVLHQDYWDGAEGFYQHLPIIGFIIRKIRDSL